MVIAGLKTMLGPFASRVRVVGEAIGAEQALDVAASLSPDVVLTDVRMHGATGLDLCQELRRRNPEQKVVLLSVYDDEQYRYQAMKVGAAGYLSKSISGLELVEHLELARGGQTVLDTALDTRTLDTTDSPEGTAFWPGARQGLTRRESEVLALMVTGLSNRAIAAQLVVSDETIKTHLRSVYRKLGVNDRAAAVATTLREGIYQ